ncbi:MAG: MBL fold metallo-hydrolase [Cyclobacteriaceae bacterium]|nr:MBL fold metallo-hydrolase [Cyclobacteriaceae bacterium]
MSYITKKHISEGITWVAIEDAKVYICCGCPADTVKHLKKAGLIETLERDGVLYENGPNAILLSDTLIQNGQIANLTEFAILQMLYLQGFNLPNHPNYKKSKPILIGYEEQIRMQLEYVTVGNHGLSSIEEIIAAGISTENAQKIFTTKLHYAAGHINSMHDIVSPCVLDEGMAEIKNQVFIKRTGINIFEILYKEERATVDLNLKANEHFAVPYRLPFREVNPGYFSVTHTGEGNGWDENRPCMASVIHYKDKYYLIDAGPNVLNNLSYLGIGLSEIDGVFLSHIHDDHFAGITELLNVERKLNFYSTRLVRKTAELKLKALMDSAVDLIKVAFNCVDLDFDEWNNFDGLEVKPIYSPHTVETSAFNFRVKTQGDYKTYLHLSDTINLAEYKRIVEGAPEVFSDQDYALIASNYLSTVDLKKIDVGGGPIHGHLEDYQHDESALLVMAHTTGEVQPSSGKFVNVPFGETHILIEDVENSYLKSKSVTFLKRYFNTLPQDQIEVLAGGPVRHFVPGEVVASKKGYTKVKLIVSGLVGYTDESGMNHRLDAGNFIGFSRKYFQQWLPDEYTAWSHVNCLEYEESYINEFIRNYSLKDDLNKRINIVRLLRESDLILDSISTAIYNRFGKYANIVTQANFDFSKPALSDFIFIIVKGEVKISFGKKAKLKVGEHQYFGGLALLRDQRRKQKFKLDDELEAIAIPVEKISNVPKLLWKLMELDEMRYQLSIFNSK